MSLLLAMNIFQTSFCFDYWLWVGKRLLAMNIFQTLFWCFDYWLWTGKYLMAMDKRIYKTENSTKILDFLLFPIASLRRSVGIVDVFWTSFVRQIYVLCHGLCNCFVFVFTQCSWTLTHFMPLVSYYTPLKTFGFLMFLRGIKSSQRNEMGEQLLQK